MALSLAKGKRVTLSKVDAFADGVAVKQVSTHCLASPCALCCRACRSLYGRSTWRMC